MLVASNIVAGYRGDPILQGVNLEVPQGKVVVVLGPNGAGKSTLFKALVGFLKLDDGSVHVGDVDMSNLAPHLRVRQGLGYVPQLERVFPSLSVQENLEMGGFTAHSEVSARVEFVSGLFPDLKKAMRVKAGGLSGGQQTMLGMARALMLKPRVLMLDEPTAGLSPLYTQRVWETIRIISESGVAVLVIEQNVRLALENSDIAYILANGKNAAQDESGNLIGRRDIEGLFVG